MIKCFNLIHDILLLIISFLVNFFSFQVSTLNNYPSVTKNKKSIIIVNGPSLKKDIKKLIYKKNSFEFYGVNYFAMTKIFKMIKPNYYAIADPIFWKKDINNKFKSDNSKLFKILSKVNWNMHLICPSVGSKIVQKKLNKNRYIKVIPLRSNYYHFKNENLNIFGLMNGILTPAFNNVLIVALWHALQRKVPYIEFYGADFSAFKELSVNQKTNALSSSITHYYKNTKAQADPLSKYPGKKRKKIHERLFQIWNSFNQMYLLSVVAKKLKIKVINFSSNSYLDTFERPK